MKKYCYIVLLLLLVSGIKAQPYVFYLHGRIVENQGTQAFDSTNGFGRYDYNGILDSIKHHHFTVISEVRPANTDVKLYARQVARQVDSLLKLKVKPGNITIIGASKGAMIAMLASAYLRNPDINFVFMAACNESNFNQYPEMIFYGNILSIYEKSDTGNGSCVKFKNRGGSVSHYKDLEINTGLRHGFLYRPIKAWLEPAVNWANGNY